MKSCWLTSTSNRGRTRRDTQSAFVSLASAFLDTQLAGLPSERTEKPLFRGARLHRKHGFHNGPALARRVQRVPADVRGGECPIFNGQKATAQNNAITKEVRLWSVAKQGTQGVSSPTFYVT